MIAYRSSASLELLPTRDIYKKFSSCSLCIFSPAGKRSVSTEFDNDLNIIRTEFKDTLMESREGQIAKANSEIAKTSSDMTDVKQYRVNGQVSSERICKP